MIAAQITAHVNIIINLNGFVHRRCSFASNRFSIIVCFESQRNVIAIFVLFIPLWIQLPVARTKSSYYSCLPLLAMQSFFMQTTVIKSHTTEMAKRAMICVLLVYSSLENTQRTTIWHIMSCKLLNTKINLHTKHTQHQRRNSNSRSW